MSRYSSREAPKPATLVLVRFGRTTLADEKLRQSCEVSFARWGLHGFSVFELLGGDYRRLARLVPLLVDRRWVLEAAGSDLLGDGFPLCPPGSNPTGPSSSPNPPLPSSPASAVTSPSPKRTRCGLARAGGSIEP